MRSKVDLSTISTIRRRRWKFVQGGILLFLLAAGVQSLVLSQQDKAVTAASSAAPTPLAPISPSQAKSAANPMSAPQTASSPQAQPADAASAALLKLATELKAEVDKSTKDTLSLGVIRKANEIEHMAHGMKDKYKASAAIN
jgi:pyruvate/2-oxoglutarate dehydrogenase complex dihydrolipoamide acyltransferase (E2) component